LSIILACEYYLFFFHFHETDSCQKATFCTVRPCLEVWFCAQKPVQNSSPQIFQVRPRNTAWMTCKINRSRPVFSLYIRIKITVSSFHDKNKTEVGLRPCLLSFTSPTLLISPPASSPFHSINCDSFSPSPPSTSRFPSSVHISTQLRTRCVQGETRLRRQGWVCVMGVAANQHCWHITTLIINSTCLMSNGRRGGWRACQAIDPAHSAVLTVHCLDQPTTMADYLLPTNSTLLRSAHYHG
jgi:hypothetical protein